MVASMIAAAVAAIMPAISPRSHGTLFARRGSNRKVRKIGR
jgi:hypothetical protein